MLGELASLLILFYVSHISHSTRLCQPNFIMYHAHGIATDSKSLFLERELAYSPSLSETYS